MSDHEMQFFSESEHKQDMSELKNWSSEEPSVPSEPEEKADLQSVERVWGRLEEHVVRNYDFYYHNRTVPPLLVRPVPIISPGETERQRSKRLLRAFPWRRLDMIAALLFITLLMGGLLTIGYNELPKAHPGEAAAGMVSPAQEICKGAMTISQQVTVVEGVKGVEVVPNTVVMRQGGQLTWVNKTSSNQVVIDGNTKEPVLKIGWYDKGQSSPSEVSTHKYYVQSAEAGQPSKSAWAVSGGGAQVMVEVLSIVMIVSGGDGVGNIFQPAALKIPQGSDLVWLNATSNRQFVVNTIHRQDTAIALSPNSCQLQHGIQQGDYHYILKGDDRAQFSLYAG
jgi:hypothetical protein